MNRQVLAWGAVCAAAVSLLAGDASAQSSQAEGVRPLPSGRRVLQAEEESIPQTRVVAKKKRRVAAPTNANATAMNTRPRPTGKAASTKRAVAGATRSAGWTPEADPRRTRPALQPIPDERAGAEEAAYQAEQTAAAEEQQGEVEPVGYYEDAPMQDNPWTESSGEVVYEDESYGHHMAMPMERSYPWWIRTEYLGWWGKGIDVPALVTTSPAGTPAATSGLLGLPGTQVLFGNQSYDEDLRGGVRFSFGYWLDPNHCRSVDGYFFGLEDAETNFSIASTGGLPILARPFFDASQQQYVAQLLSHPAVSNGQFDFNYTTQTTGGGVLMRTNAARSVEHNVDFLGGYRYTRMEDGLRIDDRLVSTATGGGIPVGTVVAGFDDIQTSNEFHGVDLGMAIDFKNQRWTLSLTAKCALGNMTQDVDINGSTTVTVPGAGSTVNAGGLLTQPTNIGSFSRNKFTVVPEATLNLRYMLNCRWTASLGYNFMFWNNVVRADDQVDFRVNPTQIAGGTLFGPGQPEFQFKETDYWLQGVNAGLELRF